MRSHSLSCAKRVLPLDLLRAVALVGVIALLVVISGCSRIPLSSLWALHKFDFENFDPATLRVAMYLPSAYSVRRDALDIDATVKRENESAHREHFTMRESRDKEDLIGLPAVGNAGGRWLVLKLEAAEVARVVAFRQGLIDRKKNTDKAKSGKASIELGAKPQFCRTGERSVGAPKFASAMMWVKEKGYITVTRESDLDEAVKSLDGSMDLSSMPAC